MVICIAPRPMAELAAMEHRRAGPIGAAHAIAAAGAVLSSQEVVGAGAAVAVSHPAYHGVCDHFARACQGTGWSAASCGNADMKRREHEPAVKEWIK